MAKDYTLFFVVFSFATFRDDYVYSYIAFHLSLRSGVITALDVFPVISISPPTTAISGQHETGFQCECLLSAVEASLRPLSEDF